MDQHFWIMFEGTEWHATAPVTGVPSAYSALVKPLGGSKGLRLSGFSFQLLEE